MSTERILSVKKGVRNIESVGGQDKVMVGKRSKKNYCTEGIEKVIHSVKFSITMTLKRNQWLWTWIYPLSFVSELGRKKDTDCINWEVNAKWSRGNVLENFKNLGGQASLKTWFQKKMNENNNYKLAITWRFTTWLS